MENKHGDPNIPDSGMKNSVEGLINDRQAIERVLETLPYKTETFSKPELQQIIGVKQELGRFIFNFNNSSKGAKEGSPEYIAIAEQSVEDVVSYLDSLNIWAHKFTTECAGGASDEEPLIETKDDSIYYMTSRGISLRLKKANRKFGLGKVIQPFFEKIFFERSEDLIEKPEVGSRAREYSAGRFYHLQNQNSVEEDYKSSIRTYCNQGKTFLVELPEPGQVHEGDRVNKIFY